MPGDFFFLNYGLQDGNVMQGLFRVNKTTYQLEVFNGSQWTLVQMGGATAVATPMTTVERTAIVPAAGVLIWDTDYDRLYVGNGKTSGGLNLNAQCQVMTTAQRTAIVPAAGVLIWDTDLSAAFIGDGTTQGGVSLAGGGGGSIVAGTRLNFDGDILNFNPVAEIVIVSGSSVTIKPDTAYKAYATTQSLTINADVPADGYWGLESHLEIFVAGAGNVHTSTNVVLSDPLEPDSVNNLTARFHDGLCILSVEDHIAGYIVVSATGSTAGTLPYALSSASQEYISFDALLNGYLLDMGGVATNKEKHIVGNGYSATILTGGISCTSSTTFSNLAMSGAVCLGGTMTLGDVEVPAGGSVMVDGGTFRIERVVGAGTVDMNGTHMIMPGKTSMYASGVTFTSGGATNGGGVVRLNTSAAATFIGCTFSDNSTTGNGGALQTASSAASIDLFRCMVTGNTASGIGGGLSIAATTSAAIVSSFVSGNSAPYGKDIANYGGNVTIDASTVGIVQMNGGTCTIVESNTLESISSRSSAGLVVISSGAVVDLSGNTNATPINPGGGITFAEGGATVLYSSGAVSGSYMMDNVALPAGAKLTNTAVVDLGGSHMVISSGATVSASDCVFSGGTAGIGAFMDAWNATNAEITLTGCTVTGMTATSYAPAMRLHLANARLNNCTFENMTGPAPFAVSSSKLVISGGSIDAGITLYMSTASVEIGGNVSLLRIGNNGEAGAVVISSGASINLTSSINPGGTGGITVLDGGCTVNGTTISAGTYTSIDSTGTPT